MASTVIACVGKSRHVPSALSEGQPPFMDTDQAVRSEQEIIEQLERAEARWSRVDALLRRLATRLTYAADGRAPRLNGALGDLRQQLREPLAEEALEPLLANLAEAITALDVLHGSDSTATTAPSAMLASELLLALIDRLRLDNASAARLDDMRKAIIAATDMPALALQAETLAGMVNCHYRQIAEQRVAMEQLLTHVTVQLDELAHYLNCESIDHREGAGARQELDRCLTGEIDALDSHMQHVHELGALQREIQSRLGAITTHLKNFHAREDAREHDWQARSEQMSQRIRELERSTQNMETSLRQEHQLASTDPLTGIANRLVFERRMLQACLQVAQTGSDICLLVLDIDRFKHVNDRFGHAAGDRALRIVAEQLQAGMRPGDLLARYGGEEFVVVLPATNVEAGIRIAETLRTCIESIDFRGKQRPVDITLSCGLTALRPDDTPESVFERADRALYKAKHRGRNRCETL